MRRIAAMRLSIVTTVLVTPVTSRATTVRIRRAATLRARIRAVRKISRNKFSPINPEADRSSRDSASDRNSSNTLSGGHNECDSASTSRDRSSRDADRSVENRSSNSDRDSSGEHSSRRENMQARTSGFGLADPRAMEWRFPMFRQGVIADRQARLPRRRPDRLH